MKRIEVVDIIMDGENIFVTQRKYGGFEGRWEFPCRGRYKSEKLLKEIW